MAENDANEEGVENVLRDPASDKVELTDGDALPPLAQLECEADAQVVALTEGVAVEQPEPEGPPDMDGKPVRVAETETKRLRVAIGEGDVEEHVETDSVALCVVEEEGDRQPEGEAEGENDTEEQRDTAPLEEKVVSALRDTVPEGEAEGQTEADGNKPLTVGVAEEEKQSVGEPEADDDTEAQPLTVPLVDAQLLTLLDIVPVGVKEGQADALRENAPVGEEEAVSKPERDTEGEEDAEGLIVIVPLAVEHALALGATELVGQAVAQADVDSVTLTVEVTDADRHSVGEPEFEVVDEGQTVMVPLSLGLPVPLRDNMPVKDTVTEDENVKEAQSVGEEEEVWLPLRDAATVGDTEELIDDESVPLPAEGDGDDVEHSVGKPVPVTDGVGQNDPVPLDDGDAETLPDDALVGETDEEVETDSVPVLVGDEDGEVHRVEEPVTVMDAVGQNDPVPLNDGEADVLRVVKLVGVAYDEGVTDSVPLIVGDGDAVARGVGEPDIDKVANGLSVTELLKEVDDDVVGQIDPVPLVDEVTDTLRDAALVGDSDDEVETDRVTRLDGDNDDVAHRVEEPVIDKVADEQGVAVLLKEGDPDGLRVVFTDGETVEHVVADSVALKVGVMDAERHSEGVPELDEDDDGHMVCVALALGHPVPLRVIVPVEDTEIDVENVKEPLLEPEEDGVRQAVGDTDGDSDDELQ